MKRTSRWANRTVLIAFLWLRCFLPLEIVAQEHPIDLQTELQDLFVSRQWIYDDFDKGIALATESGKPLFVLFR